MTPRPATFTMIELLVALAIAAVLLAALLAAFGSAWQLQRRTWEREQADLPRTAALDCLVRDLRGMVHPGGILTAPLTSTAVTAGDGRSDDATWVTSSGATNPDDPWSDLIQVHYYLADGGAPGQRQLLRTEEHNLLAVEAPTPAPVVLLDQVASFAASWYTGTDWVDSWNAQAQPNPQPQAARVRIDFAPVGNHTPPPLEVVEILLPALAGTTTGGTSP